MTNASSSTATALEEFLDRLADVSTPAGPTPRQLSFPETAKLLPCSSSTERITGPT
jgi:hypothetical protein